MLTSAVGSSCGIIIPITKMSPIAELFLHCVMMLFLLYPEVSLPPTFEF